MIKGREMVVEIDSLYVWQTPAILITKADAMREALGHRALLRDGALFREAYIAGKFANHLKSEAVRLLYPRDRPTPDFAVITSVKELWFEATEADRPDRQRNLEYKGPDALEVTRVLRDDEWVSQSAYADEIERLCRQKSLKDYDKCDGLVINSNAFGITDDHLIDEDWWRKCTLPAYVRFEQVWRFHRSAFKRITL